MPTQPLALTEKVTILQAVVDAEYRLEVAARELNVGKTTLYRKFRRWNLLPPMFSAHGKAVLRREFVERCLAIQTALQEVLSEASRYR